jgi:hypothetical protein
MSTGLKCIGVDVFLRFENYDPKKIDSLKQLGAFHLKALSNRGTRVWPGDRPAFELTDIFRARFQFESGQSATSQANIIELLKVLNELNIEWVHLEKLHVDGNKILFSEMQ